MRKDMVYAGAIHHDGAILHAYYFVSDDELEERAQLYPEQLGNFPPGAQCSYAVAGSGESVQSAGALFVRVWPDEDLVAEWTLRHEATLASEEAWNSKNIPDIYARLDPFRVAYRSLQDEERRGVLLAQMVRYVVGDDPG